jgi:hypothetical protein
VSIQGTFSMNAPGATKLEVEQAVRGTVADILSVPLTSVTQVSATQSRRLHDSVSTINSRQLQSGWFVVFKVTVEATVGDVVMQTIESLKGDITPLSKELKEQFVALGQVDTAMSLTVESFFGAMIKAEDVERPVLAVSMCGKRYSVVLVLLIVICMASESKSGGFIGTFFSGPAAPAQ